MHRHAIVLDNEATLLRSLFVLSLSHSTRSMRLWRASSTRTPAEE